MERRNNLSAWAEQGYALFAEEGLNGIQVERLARILQRNKSGFYHYFGDLDIFYLELLALHQKKALVYMDDLRCIQRIDPEYFEAVLRHKATVIFQSQLVRTSEPIAMKVAEIVDKDVASVLSNTWTEYLGFLDSPSLAMLYFAIVRDMCYARMNSRNISSVFLRCLITEAKVVMQRMAARDIGIDSNSNPSIIA